MNPNDPDPENQPTELPEQEATQEADGNQFEGGNPKLMTISNIEYEQLKVMGNEFKDKYVRLLAEQENMRKRLQKECEQKVHYAIQNAIADFLAPLDHFENALKFTEQMSEEVKHWGLGFQMILNQFKEALSNNGVHPIESMGKQLDPHLHEAIEAIPNANYAPGTIIEVITKGYQMGDKLIRPARVKVAKKEENS